MTHRKGERHGLRVAVLREPIDRGPAGIPEAEHLGDLVERFAGRVIACPAELADARRRRPVDPVNRRVTARREERYEREFGTDLGVARAPQEDREEMTHEVIDPHERKSTRPRKALCHLHADEQRADEAGSVGDGDAVDPVPRDVRLRERLAHDWPRVTQVIA